MANASITQAVTRVNVERAIALAKEQAADHRRWINAITKAAANLPKVRWQFDGDVLLIHSATRRNLLPYTVDQQGCNCDAGNQGIPCWHRAAWRLLCKAAEMVS